MKLAELDATKRRRLASSALCAFVRSQHHGFIDSCRFCSKQIIRKGQSRPRICLECEKKKATPIHDRCKDCREPIVRSNVRKARICAKCKKNRERVKTETSYTTTGLPSRLSLHGGSARIYAVNAWLCQAAQDPICNGKAPWETGEIPPKSSFPKIRTEQFNAPEDLVIFLVNRLPTKRHDPRVATVTAEVERQQHHLATPILVPQVNPFEVRDVPTEFRRQDNDALAEIVKKQIPDDVSPYIKKDETFESAADEKSTTDVSPSSPVSLDDPELEQIPQTSRLQAVVQSLHDLIQADSSVLTSLEGPLLVPQLLSLCVPSASDSHRNTDDSDTTLPHAKVDDDVLNFAALRKSQLESEEEMERSDNHIADDAALLYHAAFSSAVPS